MHLIHSAGLTVDPPPYKNVVSKVGGPPESWGVRTPRPPSGCALGRIILSLATNTLSRLAQISANERRALLRSSTASADTWRTVLQYRSYNIVDRNFFSC